MSKPVWFCQEFGTDGHVFVAIDLVMPDTSLVGMRRAIHPIHVDNDPGLLAKTVAEMSDVMGRLTAPTQPESRACAFGGGQ
jgi:hypothetical protein